MAGLIPQDPGGARRRTVSVRTGLLTGVLLVAIGLGLPAAAAAKFPIRLALADASPAVHQPVAVSVRIPAEAAGGAVMRLLAVPPGTFVDEALRFERRYAVALVRRRGTGTWRGVVRFSRPGRWTLVVPNWGAPGYASPPPVVREVLVVPARETLLALASRDGRTTLSQRDALTLAPVGRALAVGRGSDAWTRSPGGRYLALASSREGLTIVDLRTMRASWRLPRGILVRALAWPAPGRLLLVEHAAVLLVDPVGRRLLGRVDYEGAVLQAEPWRDGVAALVSAGDGRIEPARLVVVGPGLRLRTVALPGILAGVDGGEGNAGPFRGAWPALAVDRAAGRAYVAGGERVAAVELAAPAASAARPQRTPQKAASGPTRNAAWLDGVLALSGYDLAVRAEDGREAVTGTAYGLRYVRDGEQQLVDPQATHVVAAGGLALVHGTQWWLPSPARATGLAAYDAAGALRWRALPGLAIDALTVVRGRVYVRAGAGWHVLDARTGELLSRPVAPPGLWLLGS